MIYTVGIAAAFVAGWLAIACFVLVALIWLVPDRRMENFVRERHLDVG